MSNRQDKKARKIMRQEIKLAIEKRLLETNKMIRPKPKWIPKFIWGWILKRILVLKIFEE